MNRCVLLVICLLFLNLSFINCSKNGHRGKRFKFRNNDSPQKNDLTRYVEIIERVSNFYAKNTNEVDINVYFGLFLCNVNLKRVLVNEKIWHISSPVRDSINEIIYTNEELSKFFLDKAENDNQPENRIDKMMLPLFNNESEWFLTMEPFNASTTLKEYAANEMNYFVLSDWNRYVDKVYNVNEGTPNPVQSDECLASLADNPSSYGYLHSLCKVDEFCYKMIQKGTDYGYALTHRLLILLLARYGRSCSIFSPEEDRHLSEKFCALSYEEAQYIAVHNFGMVDLMLESMCLCGLNGQVDFLRQSWLEKISRFQTTAGCFGQTARVNSRRKQKLREWKLNRGDDQDMLSGLCNGHVTALATATYALAVRFILEIVY